MGMIESARSTWTEVEAVGRLLRNAKRFLPRSEWNVSRLVARNAETLGKQPAILIGEARYTWADVEEQVARYAGALRALGVKAGDVAALLMDNRAEFVFSEVAITRVGGISALINTNLAGPALVHAINIGAPKLVIVGSEHAEQVADVVSELELGPDRLVEDTDQSNPAPARFRSLNELVGAATPYTRHIPTDLNEGMCYIYTSGTTGLPKAAVVTHKRFLLAAHLFGHSVHNAASDDVIYVTLPLYHSNAQWAGFGASCSTGAAMALRRKFSVTQFWNDARTYGATHFIYIGELCRYLLNQPASASDRDHNIRGGTGNGLRPDIWEAFTRRFGIPAMREFYGATEGNAPMFNLEGRPGMVGRLRPGQILVKCDLATGEIVRNARGLCDRVGIGETGLLLGKINALTKFDGYVDASATQKKVVSGVLKRGDSYFNSGDLLTLHADKWVSFADRVGDTFRWKGENVSTNEVAEILNAAPGVLEANVYGVSVPGKDGRAGMASLNIEPGDFNVAQLAEFVVSKLPNYQRPFFIRVQNDMRITQTFKHQKVAYRDEGYDPTQVEQDQLYFLDVDKYIPIDAEVYSRIQRGELEPR